MACTHSAAFLAPGLGPPVLGPEFPLQNYNLGSIDLTVWLQMKACLYCEWTVLDHAVILLVVLYEIAI